MSMRVHADRLKEPHERLGSQITTKTCRDSSAALQPVNRLRQQGAISKETIEDICEMASTKFEGQIQTLRFENQAYQTQLRQIEANGRSELVAKERFIRKLTEVSMELPCEITAYSLLSQISALLSCCFR